MRILWVLTTKCARNGITSLVMNYYMRLDPARAQVDFVTINEPPADIAALVSARGGRFFVMPSRNRRPAAYVWKLARLIRDNGYAVVHAHGNSRTLTAELLAAKLGGAPVRIPHCHNTSCTHSRLHRLLRRPFNALCTAGMACGRDAGAFLFEEQPFTVLNNAVETARFAFDAQTRAHTRARLGYPDSAFVLGHIGTFTPRKNQAFLIEALRLAVRRRPDARLLFVGAGETEPAVRAAADAAGLRDFVCFYGETDDPAPLYAAMDAFALPSLYEGLPVTLVEAQSSGLCCYASDAVARESDLSGLVRFLPLAGGADAWADAIAAQPAADRSARSRAAIRRIADAGYDAVESGDALLRLYERFISEART